MKRDCELSSSRPRTHRGPNSILFIMTEHNDNHQRLLRALPSVDAILRTPQARALRAHVGAEQLLRMARAVTEELRAVLLESAPASANGRHTRAQLLAEAVEGLSVRARVKKSLGCGASSTPRASYFIPTSDALRWLKKRGAQSLPKPRVTARWNMTRRLVGVARAGRASKLCSRN